MPSSVIRRFDYHPERRELEILFVTGRRYVYHDVPADIPAAMRRALSKGEFFNAEIRDRYAFTRLDDRPRGGAYAEPPSKFPS